MQNTFLSRVKSAIREKNDALLHVYAKKLLFEKRKLWSVSI